MSSLPRLPFDMQNMIAAIVVVCVIVLGFMDTPAPENQRTEDGRLIINYWEKWTGLERESMQTVVDDFNRSQDRLFVKMLSVSNVDQKLMLATAGGNPPDVAGIWSHTLNVFAPKGALSPLNSYCKNAGIGEKDYHPAFWRICNMHGFIWGLPSTPATLGLHWNRRLFREAGLDPDQPPTTLAELSEYAEKLTIVDIERNGKTVRVRYPDLSDAEKKQKNFTIAQLGYTPSEPGWFDAMWGFWFGASLWDGEKRVTPDSPENIVALEWYSSFPHKYGLKNLQQFGSSFGNFASPQNPFLDERVAMELQGVWMYNFIDKYAPQLDWAAAPFPPLDPQKTPDVTIAECDVLVIPRGSPHPEEAFEFIRFVQRQKNLEKLALGQRKFSPLAKTSSAFLEKHPNKYIKIFIDLAASENACTVPQIPIWDEYKNELLVAYNLAFTGSETPENALADVRKRCQVKLDRINLRWEKIKDSRLQEWSNQIDTP